MKVSSSYFGVLILLFSFPICPASAQELGSWELGINYPDDDSANPFEISPEGSVNVEFFIENSGITEITVQLEYEIPFGGEFDAPEEESIPSGTNQSFDLKISGIDVQAFDAEKKEKYRQKGSFTSLFGPKWTLGII